MAAAREVIGLWRLTAEANTADQQPLLATALANLGLGLHDLGQSREAVAAAEEAVGLWQALARRHPERAVVCADGFRGLRDFDLAPLALLTSGNASPLVTRVGAAPGRGLGDGWRLLPTSLSGDLAAALHKHGSGNAR